MLLSKDREFYYLKYMLAQEHKFSRNLGATSESYVQEGDMEQVSYPHMFSPTIQNLIARVTTYQGYVHLCI